MRGSLSISTLVFAVLAGCLQSSAGPDPPPPSSIQAVQNPMSGQVGTQIEPAVRVRDAVGADMPGIAVLWTGSEGLTVNPSSSRTDANGTATTVVSIGTVAGQFEVGATATGLTALAITINAEPGPAQSLVLSEETITFTALQQTRTVSAVGADTYGNQVPGSAIVWVSRNTAVADVNGSGTITSRAGGQTWVVASSGQAQDSVAVTVSP